MPMNRFFTLNYLVNSYCNGKKEVESLKTAVNHSDMETEVLGFEPSQKSIDAILNFASQYEVLKSDKAGSIELNLN
jgi:hypothetical protein